MWPSTANKIYPIIPKTIFVILWYAMGIESASHMEVAEMSENKINWIRPLINLEPSLAK